MRRFRLLLIVVALLGAAAAYAYGFEEGSHQGRLARHLLGTAVQIFAPLVAGVGCLAATRAYAPGDRERAVWTTGAIAALVWATGRVVLAGYQWWGGTARPYPSIADGFYVIFYVLLGVANHAELRETLVFKGGTALKKVHFGSYRFSEDLDFSAADGPREAALEQAVRVAVDAAQTAARQLAPIAMTIDRYEERDPHPGGQESFIVRVQFPSGRGSRWCR
jgi:hypothetical protein